MELAKDLMKIINIGLFFIDESLMKGMETLYALRVVTNCLISLPAVVTM